MEVDHRQTDEQTQPEEDIRRALCQEYLFENELQQEISNGELQCQGYIKRFCKPLEIDGITSAGPRRTTTMLVSSMGSGKTQAMLDVICGYPDLYDVDILFISERITLAHSLTSSHNARASHQPECPQMYLYNELPSSQWKNARRLCVQLESLWKWDINRRPVIVVVDEIRSLHAHFASATMNDVRRLCFEMYSHVIANAVHVLGLDKDLSPADIRLALRMRSNVAVPPAVAPSTPRLVVNGFKGQLHTNWGSMVHQ